MKILKACLLGLIVMMALLVNTSVFAALPPKMLRPTDRFDPITQQLMEQQRLIDAARRDPLAMRSATSVNRNGVPRAIAANVRLSNLSTLTNAPAGNENPPIVGFYIGGTSSKTVLIRMGGPSLNQFSVANFMKRPHVRVVGSSATSGDANYPYPYWDNNGWQGQSTVSKQNAQGISPPNASSTYIYNSSDGRSMSTIMASVGAYAYTPGANDAALVLTLAPGSYSILGYEETGASGQNIIEVYELDSTTKLPRLVNLSTRALVRTTEPVIAGFYVNGGPRHLLIRAIGPTLRNYKVTDYLRDPKLEVYNGQGVKIAENDNWVASVARSQLRNDVGAFPPELGSTDAEMDITLPSGAYSVQVRSGDGTNGTALIEIYEDQSDI